MHNLSQKEKPVKNFTCPICGKSSTQKAIWSNSPGSSNICFNLVEIIKGIEITTENINNPKDIPIASDPET